MMRKYIIVTILCTLLHIVGVAKTTRNVTLTFNASDFNMETIDGKLHITSSVHTVVFHSDTLSPAMPFVCVNVLIGPNDEYAGVKTMTNETLLQSDVELPPNPIPIPTNFTGIVRQPDAAFNSPFDPSEKIEYTGTLEMGGYRFVSFLLCPFRYEPSGGKLFLNTQINISLSVKNNAKTAGNHNIMTSEYIREDVGSMVVNPDCVELLYPVSLGLHRDQNSSIRYLIVTCDSLKNEFQRLADWKTMKGYKAKVITVEDISGSNPISPLIIKQKLAEIYEDTSGSLQYVLLGGDENIVPVQNCYAETTTNDGTETANSSCDIFYACLNTMNWDGDEDGIYGEVNDDNVDLTMHFAISRLPVQNVSNAQNVIDRIIGYEKNPSTDYWKNDFLMCGADYYKPDSVTVSTFQLASENMYAQYVTPTGWNGGKFRFYDTFTDCDTLGANYNVTGTNLTTELGKGYSFVNVNAHGWTQGWMLEAPGYYTSTHASSQTINGYSTIFTQACDVNKLVNYALGSTFINNPNCNVIALYGCSDLGIRHGDGSIGKSEEYCGKVMQKLFTGNTHFGKSVRETKSSFLANCSAYNSTRWLYLFMNPLCDPETPIYTESPDRFSPSCMIGGTSNSFSLTPNNVNYDICIMSRLDKGASYYYTNNSFYGTTFSGIPNESIVCVTATNYVPFRSIYGSYVKLQNESLADNLNVMAYELSIGSSVDNTRNSGPVTVENGKSVISTMNGVTIQNDFEVKLGASLEIIHY